MTGRMETLAVCSCNHQWRDSSTAKTSLGGLYGTYLGHHTLRVSIYCAEVHHTQPHSSTASPKFCYKYHLKERKFSYFWLWNLACAVWNSSCASLLPEFCFSLMLFYFFLTAPGFPLVLWASKVSIDGKNVDCYTYNSLRESLSFWAVVGLIIMQGQRHLKWLWSCPWKYSVLIKT